MSLLDKLLGRTDKPKETARWQPPQEGASSPPGFRPKGWEYPPKKPGDSDIGMVSDSGEPASKPVLTRVPEATVPSKPAENKG